MEQFPLENKPRKTKEEVLSELSRYEPLKFALEIHDVTNAKELVDRLSSYETKAGFEHVFGKLARLSSLEKVKVEYKALNYLDDKNPSAACFRQSTNTIYIDSTYANSAEIGDFYSTILHELFHEVFKGADIASGLNLIYGLTNIKNTISKLPVHNKYRNLYAAVLRNVPDGMRKNHYGLSSVDEFISESYSNPEFQNFLKTVELDKQKSATDKTKDLLLSVVTLNNRLITSNISEQNAFKAFQAIDLSSLNLLEDFQANLSKYRDR